MTATVMRRRPWLLPAGILVAMGVYLWTDPVAVHRARQTEQAIKEDPNSGAGLADTSEPTGSISARQIDRLALSTLFRASNVKSSGTAAFSVLVDPDGRVFDVRALDTDLDPVAAQKLVDILQGKQVFVPLAGAATTRTILGPVKISDNM